MSNQITELEKKIRAAIKAKSDAQKGLDAIAREFAEIDLDDPANWPALGFEKEAEAHASNMTELDAMDASEEEGTDADAKRYAAGSD